MSPLLQTELLGRMAAAYPDGVAWRNLADGSELSLGTWDAMSNRLARGLQAKGVGPGDRVALAVSPNEPLTWLITYMGIHKSGGTAVPLNTRLQEAELGRIVRHAAPSLVVASPDVVERCAGLGDGSWLLASTDDIPRDGVTRWAELVATDASPLNRRIDPDGVADIMYTSGTTGEPKGVVVTHGDLAAIDRVPDSWLGLGFLTSSPFSTTSGSLLVCGPMRGGLSGWFLPQFNVERWLEIVSTERPVAAFVVPAMAQLIVADANAASYDLSSLAVVNVGSAPIAGETLRRFGQLLGGTEVLVGYGMTEFGAATAVPMGDRGRHLGSVGRPLPDVELRIIDSSGGDAEAGEVGEVLLRGARGPRRYFRQDPAEDAWSEDWLHSGDLGHLDGDGFLWIDGRMKETIIRGGHNVMPGEVESVLYTHPAVAEAAVAGIPHAVLGEDVAAWVVVQNSDVTAEELRRFMLDQLADYKVPRSILFVTSLPRNDAGKVLKGALVTDFVAHARSPS